MTDTKPHNPTSEVVAIEEPPGGIPLVDTAGDRSEPKELLLVQNFYPNVSSQNVETSWTTTLSPGSAILFQHQHLDGWRKGVIEEVIIVDGIFVKAVIQANVKKRGKLTKQSFDVHRDDWIKRRFR